MPGWHASTQDDVDAGKLQVLGIIQEQHPDRCQLFMQWHEMTWPIWVDSLNLLEVTAVPITLLIDEVGVIQSVNPSRERYERFLQQPSAGERAIARPEPLEAPEPIRPKSDSRDPDAWAGYATDLMLWGAPNELDDAIEAFSTARRRAPEDGRLAFRLGAAYRTRFDSPYRQAEDFGMAIDQWTAALERDPNQYIWRRRIQQYGPRLDKPYPFYDWVIDARESIRARGDVPRALIVEPQGAEIATPAQALPEPTVEPTQPDPMGRILRDEGWVALDATVVGDTSQPGQALRIHLLWTPETSKKAHWNNEAEDMEVWLQAPTGWELASSRLSYTNPRALVESTPRAFDFELRRVESEIQDTVLQGYALYYICEDVNGVCLYRRQDFEIPLAP